MYKGPCDVPGESRFHYDKYHSCFQKRIKADNIKIQRIHHEEVKSTLENPKVRQANETTAISRQLLAIKDQDHLTQKRRQQLRENTEELRQLENALRAAQISLQASEQKTSINNRVQDRIRLMREEEQKEEAVRRKFRELDRQKMLEEYKRKQELQNALLNQMSEHQQRVMMQHEENLRDREKMKELLHSYQLEHEKEINQLEKRKESARQEIQEFLESQERIKKEQRSEKADENVEYLEMMRIKDEQQRKEKEYRKCILEHKQAISDNIGRKILEEKAAKRERYELIQDLLMEEVKAKEHSAHLKIYQKEALEKELARLESERYHEHCLLTKKHGYMSEQDKIVYDEQMRILAEHDRLEQLSAERRRKKQNDHRRFIIQMMEDNRQKRAEENAEKIRVYELLAARQRKIDEDVEAERLRMLCGQPPEVLRYLPASMIKDEYREMLGLSQVKKK